MITEDERFIKIQGILAMSDVHPADCIKINDLIIELSKENKQLKSVLKEIREYVNNSWTGGYTDETLKYKVEEINITELLEIIDKGIKENDK